jgi:hypothetical protein
MSTSNSRPVRTVWQVQVKPGQMAAFMDVFTGNRPMAQRVWGSTAQVLRTAVGGAGSGSVVLVTDFENMADFGERWDRAQSDDEWLEFLAWFNGPDSPVTTLSIALMSDITP